MSLTSNCFNFEYLSFLGDNIVGVVERFEKYEDLRRFSFGAPSGEALDISDCERKMVRKFCTPDALCDNDEMRELLTKHGCLWVEVGNGCRRIERRLRTVFRGTR